MASWDTRNLCAGHSAGRLRSPGQRDPEPHAQLDARPGLADQPPQERSLYQGGCGQARLGPIERLYLGFLIDAKDDRLVRRIEVEPDYVGEFFQKLRVARQLESPGEMRLEIVTAQDVIYRRLTNTLIGCQGPATPMRAPFRLRLQSCVDDRLDTVRAIGWLTSATRRELP